LRRYNLTLPNMKPGVTWACCASILSMDRRLAQCEVFRVPFFMDQQAQSIYAEAGGKEKNYEGDYHFRNRSLHAFEEQQEQQHMFCIMHSREQIVLSVTTWSYIRLFVHFV
jgi:hypothetical protein